MFICATGILTSITVGEPVNRSEIGTSPAGAGNEFIGGEAAYEMNGMISLLRELGLDISYGNDNGTIFSMLDDSLTRIITDLSSGNSDNFLEVPLINETMRYFGISPDEIILHPEDAPDSLEAVDRYNQRFSNNPKFTNE